MNRHKFGLIGNPNTGKSSLFNRLTGLSQRVGNWAGVTVERKVGHCTLDAGTALDLHDLPGLYSLSVYAKDAIDQQIACQALLDLNLDGVINIIDAANLERNLYLTIQLLELGMPVFVVLNMCDIAEKNGQIISCEALEKTLGVPVVSVNSRKGRGFAELKTRLQKWKRAVPDLVEVPEPLKVEMAALIQAVKKSSQPMGYSPRWLAQRLLEDDVLVQTYLARHTDILEQAKQAIDKISKQSGDEPDLIFADARYALAREIRLSVVTQRTRMTKRFGHFLDKLVLNRYLGVPIFLLVMYLMFEFSVTLGGALQPLFDEGSTVIFVQGIEVLGHAMAWPLWLTALMANGLGLGINTVLTFIPQIALLFLALAFLEDCGYMSRAAFVMDRLMQAVGLPGKSFVPLIIGFGCNVPAVMAARTLEGQRDRLLTIIMSPFMSCGARLAIFAVFASAFFPKGGALVVFLLYVIGIVIALFTGWIFHRWVLKGEPEPFAMEIPRYHRPQLGSMLRQCLRRTKAFVFRAGRWIIPICMLVGTLNAITVPSHHVSAAPKAPQSTLLSVIGQEITPLFGPIGISQSNWPASVGLLTGTLAKEVVVGTLNTLYAPPIGQSADSLKHYSMLAGLKTAWDDTLQSIMHLSINSFANPFVANEADHTMSASAMGEMVHAFGSQLSAFCYLLFVLLYVPCVSTIAVTVRESSKRWALASTLWSTSIAYVSALWVYQACQLSLEPLHSVAWLLGSLLYMIVLVIAMARFSLGPGFQLKRLSWGGSHA